MISFFPIPTTLNYLGEQPNIIEKIIIAAGLVIIILGISGLIKICEIIYKKIEK